MEDNTKRGSSITVAFLLGAVAGGVAALLLAPQSGSELRGEIKRRAGDLREKGERLAQQGGENAEMVSGAIRSAATEAKQAYRSEMDKQREGHATVGPDAKRFTETEMAGSKLRPGSQS